MLRLCAMPAYSPLKQDSVRDACLVVAFRVGFKISENPKPAT